MAELIESHFSDVIARRGMNYPPTAGDLASLPTDTVATIDDLKLDNGKVRVWLSRGTVEDGEPCDGKVSVEVYGNGAWMLFGEYCGRYTSSDDSHQFASVNTVSDRDRLDSYRD